MALFIFAVFVISLVPMAIADDGQDNERSDLRQKVLERRGNVLEKRMELVKMKEELLNRHRGQIQELVNKCSEKGFDVQVCKGRFEQRLKNLETLPEDFKLKLAEFEQRRSDDENDLEDLKNDSNFSKHKKELNFKSRLIPKINLENARKELAKFKLEFKESKSKLDNAKLRLDNARELNKACKNSTSEECIKAKAELLAAAKEHFAAQADNIIKTLEKIKSSVQGSEDLTDAEEANMTADLTAEITKITAIKAKINAATNKEELLTAAKELRDAWKDLEYKAKKHAARVVSSRMAGIIVTSKHLEVKLNKVLERMTEKGQNVSEVQVFVDEFHKHIDLAKASFEASQDLWAKVKFGTNSNVTVQQAQEKLKEAKEHLKLAREELGKIIQKLDKGVLKEVEDEEDDDEDSSDSTPTNTTNTTA